MEASFQHKSKHPILHTYLENRILNKNELYILKQNIKTSEAIQEIVWKNKLVNAKAFINKPKTKASNAMDVRGTAATRRGESFG